MIARALDAGYEPAALLMERRQLGGPGRELAERCGEVPLYTADRRVLAVCGMLSGAGLLVILCVPVISYMFLKSVLTPIRQIGTAARRIAQGDFAARIRKANDDELGELCDTINELSLIHILLVFTRTKHGADRVARDLNRGGFTAQAIHGNKSQSARQAALTAFKQGQCRVLVATDIAARGIDIEELALVVNYDIPNVPETYVHRIGRTGRAGLGGTAVALSLIHIVTSVFFACFML